MSLGLFHLSGIQDSSFVEVHTLGLLDVVGRVGRSLI